MKAILVREIGTGFVTGDIVLAHPAGSEVLIVIKASGLCHTDLTMASHEMGNPLPMLLGHEAAGIVSAVGPMSLNSL